MRQTANSAWTAHTTADKARARRLIKQGLVRIASRTEEEYDGRHYEVWNIEPVK